MTQDYSIELHFSYENLDDHEKDIKGKSAKAEIEKLATEFEDEFFAFDEDIGIDKNNFNISKLGLNYNWRFNTIEKIKEFILNLPNHYKILWIHNQNKTNSDLTYVVYSSYNHPKTSKFNQMDKEIYIE